MKINGFIILAYGNGLSKKEAKKCRYYFLDKLDYNNENTITRLPLKTFH